MVRLVVDSSCDLTPDFCQNNDVEMIPLSVAFKDKLYYENIDMTKDEFYKMMVESDELPKTSQPSPQEYLNLFEKLSKQGHEIVVLTVTSALSGCYQSAMIAKSMCENAKIEIIDTKNAAIGVQIQALEIIKMIKSGLLFDKIVEIAKENVAKTRLIAAIDTLQNLVKGGRVSKTEGLVGTLVDLKPLVSFDPEGKIVSIAKSRGMKRALKLMLEKMKSEVIDDTKAMVCGYTANPVNMNRLLEMIDDVKIQFESYVSVGAVIGTHAGPNAAAVAYFVKK